MSEYIYEVRTEADDPAAHTLVKKNVEVEFTMNELLAAQDHMAKMLTEYRAEMEVCVAEMKNVEEHHPDAVNLVRNLDPVKQNAAYIWLKAYQKFNALGPNKDKLVEAMRADRTEIEEITKQTGVELPEGYEYPELNGTPSTQKDDSAEEGE